MRDSLTWICGAALLAISCSGDDTGAMPGESESGGPTTDDPDTSAGPAESSETGIDPSMSSTTGTEESSTGPSGLCGNDGIDEDEVCDGIDLGGQDCAAQGFDGGDLGCAADCAAFDTSACITNDCGNGAVDGAEACDGAELGGATCETEGFESGTLACAADCTALDTSGCASCGNAMVEGDEVCDGTLAGQSCVTQGFDSGALACGADCLTFDTTACGECGNNLIDGTEFCDGLNLAGMDCGGLGYDSGTLACAGNCTGFEFAGCGTCGNSLVDGDEFCDGAALGGQTCITQGFDSGNLACDASCGAFVTAGCGTCGDDILDPSETCDGLLLDGETCASLGLNGGELACSASCQYDVGNCEIPGIPFGSDSGYSGYALQLQDTQCDDISGSGTPTLLTDDSVLAVPIGFTFPVYGVDYDTAAIQSNGVLRFGNADYLSFGNECLPTAIAPSTDNLYVFWDDLNPSVGAGEIYYQTLGADGSRRFVVQWDTAHFGGDSVDLMRVQAMLNEATGQIIVCYPDTLNAGNTGDNGAEATSGIQRNAMDGFDFSCNTPDLVNGTQLLYVPG